MNSKKQKQNKTKRAKRAWTGISSAGLRVCEFAGKKLHN